MPLHDVSNLEGGGWKSWAPGWTGFSVNPTLNFARYLQVGMIVFFTYAESVLGTSNATTFTITGLPIVAATTNNIQPCRVTDNGTAQSTPGRFVASGTVLTLALNLGGSAFTNSGSKGASIAGWYEVAV